MKLDTSIFRSKKRMAACFDFRMRTSSFDLHQLTQRNKLAKISKLFRSRSDSNVKHDSPKQSPKSSPKGSPTGQVRRRFVRVVRNEESAGEEYENPHIIRRYTEDFVQQQWRYSGTGSLDDANLPYEVSGHTILKKHNSEERADSADECSPVNKHTSFKEEVEIIEFDKKLKILQCTCYTHVEKLQDSDDETGNEICPHCQKKGIEDCPHVSSDSDQSDSDLPRESNKSKAKPSSTVSATSEKSDSKEKESTKEQSNCDGEESTNQTSDSLTLVQDEIPQEKKYTKFNDSSFIVDQIISVHTGLQECERSRGIPASP